MRKLIAVATFGFIGVMGIVGVALGPALAHEDDGQGMMEAADDSAGVPGDADTPSRTIEVEMQDAGGKLRFIPGAIQVAQGEQIKFVVHNAGALEHEFILGTKQENAEHAEMMKKMPGMKHDEPNQLRLAPNASAEVLWKFTKAGEFEFACLIPGHHEAGMWGTVMVK